MADMKFKLIVCTTLSLVLGLAFTAAQAAVIQCTGGTCNGTPQSDDIRGSAVRDEILGRAGGDIIRGFGGNDSCGGGGGNDTIECGVGRDYQQGGSGDDTFEVSLDGGAPGTLVGRDTYKGGNGGNDRFFYNTSESGPDRILDFGERGAATPTPGDVVQITNLTTDRLRAVYGDSIAAGDPGVSSSNGDLLVNFAAPGIGAYTLTFTGLAGQSLIVGDDIVGSP